MEGQYTADRRLSLDASGNVVEADDPSRVTLLVAKGGTLPMEDARRYGLVDDEGNPVARADAESDADADEAATEDAEAKPKRAASKRPATKK